MSDAIKVALVASLANGLVTWGIVSTKLDWMRRDIDKQDIRIERLYERTESSKKESNPTS